jgi:signal transduction histidine kinase
VTRSLSWKIALVIMLGVAVVQAVYGYMRIEREANLFERDMRRDHTAIGAALAVAASSAGSRHGRAVAIEVLEDVNLGTARAIIAWVDADTRGAEAGTTFEVLSDADGNEVLVSRTAATLAPGDTGFIEIREPLTEERAFIAGTVQRIVSSTLIVVLISFAIVTIALWILVRRPMKELLAKVDRVGRGDLGGPLRMEQRDEIGVLGRSLNVMCDRLQQLSDQRDRETEAKIAAVEQLRHVERLSTVGKLASGLAHELGTPLNVISAHAKLIVRGQSTGDEVLNDAGSIAAQADRMTAIIRQFLDFARKRKPQRRSEYLRRLCEDSVRLLLPLAGKSGVSIEIAPSEGSVEASVDPVQFQQVVTNIVVNAIQAQPNGGSVRLAVDTSDQAPPAGVETAGGSHPRVAIEDDGPGVASEVRDSLFEPFVTTKDVGEGTGLGLSVAYGIVREHQGWIAVQNGAGRGARFEIHLPAEAT